MGSCRTGPVADRPRQVLSGLRHRWRFVLFVRKALAAMLSLLLLPGDLICDLAGVPAASDHRQVLRSFINMIVWGAVAIGLTLVIGL